MASGKLEPWQQKHMGKNWYLQVLRGGCCCCFCCWVGGWVVCFPEIPVCEDEDLSSNDALGDPRIERYSSTRGLLGQFFFFINLYRQHLSNDMSMTYLSNEEATYLSQDASHHQGCHIFYHRGIPNRNPTLSRLHAGRGKSHPNLYMIVMSHES